MRILVSVLALTLVAAAAAPALAEDGMCPRAAQAAAMSQYLKSQAEVATVPPAETPAPTAESTEKTTTTTPTGG